MQGQCWPPCQVVCSFLCSSASDLGLRRLCLTLNMSAGLPPPDYTVNEVRTQSAMQGHEGMLMLQQQQQPSISQWRSGGSCGGGGGAASTQLGEHTTIALSCAHLGLQAGERIIAASRRPDGTVRKERRVRAGYVPQDEQQVYVSRGAAVSAASAGCAFRIRRAPCRLCSYKHWCCVWAG